ncbi:ornithine cyclodeaminase [Demequina globuliformis]|uniref:ornithine cyclodeaminase n=1 Tax=Demequina globuliformis TaxID=676202 RepID=UPI0007852086|nr:ornithine cyclodeaminase [Demequina globuliformis]
MVMLVDVPRMTAWIRHTGAERIIADIAARLETDYARWPQFDKVERIAAHSPIGVIELMPIADADRYGFKYVNGHPANPARGLQTVTAFGAYADVHTGYPILIAEMTLLTALRTAATSAMAARHLARADSEVMAIIGNGSQSEFQALGMRGALGITSLRIWDTDPAAMDKLQRNLEPHGFTVYRATSARDACRGADIITTATADKALAQIVANDWVEPGMHLNAIGGDCPGKTELDTDILRRADVFVEYEPQTRIEGEIQHLPADHPVTELWTVITGQATGRTSPAQITVFDSVGFALEDLTALAHVADAVQGTEFAGEIDLVASPADPRDLFGMVVSPASVPSSR